VSDKKGVVKSTKEKKSGKAGCTSDAVQLFLDDNLEFTFGDAVCER
jgi:hypothetical protein